MDTSSCVTEPKALRFDLGTFEGFNFRSQSAMCDSLTAAQVVNWDHDRNGEAEFWPSGDRPEVSLVFEGRTSVTCSELVALDDLLEQLGGDSSENFVRIHHALNTCSSRLGELSAGEVEARIIYLFFGDSFIDLRRTAAFELFELYYPEEYCVWEKSHCDGLIFDEDRFLDSPGFSVEELKMGAERILLVAPD